MEHSRDEQRTLWSCDAPSARIVAGYDGPRLALDVHGEADRDTAGRLLADLVSALRPELESVRVDLTGLSFCDLAGSDALHAFVDEAGNRGVCAELHGMSSLVALLYSAYPSYGARLAGDVGLTPGSAPPRQRPISPGTRAGSVMT